jgi:hypothetical protein
VLGSVGLIWPLPLPSHGVISLLIKLLEDVMVLKPWYIRKTVKLLCTSKSLSSYDKKPAPDRFVSYAKVSRSNSVVHRNLRISPNS